MDEVIRSRIKDFCKVLGGGINEDNPNFLVCDSDRVELKYWEDGYLSVRLKRLTAGSCADIRVFPTRVAIEEDTSSGDMEEVLRIYTPKNFVRVSSGGIYLKESSTI